MDRQPIVSGQFYPGDAKELSLQVEEYLASGQTPADRRTLLAMAPHAGYPFSGPTAGKVMATANLAQTIIMLGPNHSGRGRALAVWPEGGWLTPLGRMSVESNLADALIEAEPRLSRDYEAHMYEHSLEVVVPFIAARNKDARIVPICVAEHRPDVLLSVAESMARVIGGWKEPVSLVVSSDMSHYVSHDAAKKQDSLALSAIEALDSEGLLNVVRREGISMCGVLPMTLGLAVAKALGAQSARVVDYSTSGETSGDFERVVGYAGVIVD
jgi:hypothetical protein